MKKFFRGIHLWLSLPFGLIIAIVCLTGAVLVFEDEIKEMRHRDMYYVEKVGAVPLPISQLMERVSSTLPDSVSITGLTAFSNPERTYQVKISKPMRASICVDPYTGEVKGRSERSAFFLFMFKMHRSLLGNMKPAEGTISVGKLAVGVSTLLLVVILISGLVIWIPRSRKALKNGLTINTRKGWRRFWYDLHVSGGVYTTVVLLVLALTGLTWSFPWYRTAFYQVFGVETKRQTSDKPSRKRPEINFANWQNVYEQLTTQNATYQQITIADGTASVSLGELGNQRAAHRYTFEPKDGQVITTSLYEDQEKSAKMRGWIYSVHVGNWGGMPTRILSFLAALLGATLPLTGYYLWMKKRMRKKQRIA